jgi:hypothetical protein
VGKYNNNRKQNKRESISKDWGYTKRIKNTRRREKNRLRGRSRAGTTVNNTGRIKKKEGREKARRNERSEIHYR